MASGRTDTTGILGYVVAFIFYVVMYSVIFYFNTALVGAAMIRLEGGDPTVGDGFRIASKHSGKIIGYALISATVGVILRAISERGGIIGEIVSGIFGFAWGLATFMVVPVLVLEDVGPIEAVKRSAALLKQTWGEQLVGNFSIGSIFGLLTLLVILVSMGLFAVAASLNSGALMALVSILGVVTVIALSLVSSALDGIYKAALYRYAVHGETGGFFDPALIEGAFRRK
jgi:hypothetical protein